MIIHHPMMVLHVLPLQGGGADAPELVVASDTTDNTALVDAAPAPASTTTVSTTPADGTYCTETAKQNAERNKDKILHAAFYAGRCSIQDCAPGFEKDLYGKNCDEKPGNSTENVETDIQTCFNKISKKIQVVKVQKGTQGIHYYLENCPYEKVVMLPAYGRMLTSEEAESLFPDLRYDSRLGPTIQTDASGYVIIDKDKACSVYSKYSNFVLKISGCKQPGFKQYAPDIKVCAPEQWFVKQSENRQLQTCVNYIKRQLGIYDIKKDSSISASNYKQVLMLKNYNGRLLKAEEAKSLDSGWIYGKKVAEFPKTKDDACDVQNRLEKFIAANISCTATGFTARDGFCAPADWFTNNTNNTANNTTQTTDPSKTQIKECVTYINGFVRIMSEENVKNLLPNAGYAKVLYFESGSGTQWNIITQS